MRIKKYLPELLDGVELTTSQIQGEIQNKWPNHAPTINSIGNILAGHSKIEKVGFDDFYIKQGRTGILANRRRNCVWTAKEE